MSDFQTGTLQEIRGPDLPLGPAQTVIYNRYAAFTVNASFQGESTGPHKAFFIFGAYGHGRESIIACDPITGEHDNVGLSDLLAEPDYPEGFLRGKLRENPEIADWVRSNEMPASSCGSPTGKVCCSRGRCGISEADLNRDLATPLPPMVDSATPQGASSDGSEANRNACQVRRESAT